MTSRKKAPRHSVDISEEAGVRYLHFGSDWVQGAMRIARPWSLELDYTREMMAGLLLRPDDWPRSALLVGLGAGSLAKFLYRYRPDCRITVVALHPQVEFVARQYIKLPDDPRRLEVVDGCGADYLLGGDRRFDYILVDGFDPEGRPGVLDTEPFYQACRARLSDTGLFCVNLLRGRGFNESVKRIAAAFDDRLRVLPPCDSGNTIALAGAGEMPDLDPEALKPRAAALKQASKLDLNPLLKRLAEAGPPCFP
jgi:spermidine synthase